jgi:hypothetical protein
VRVAVIFDYFAAASDDAAADLVDTGPALGVVRDTGIDPLVQMGTLEELLTGRPYDDVLDDPRCADALVVRDRGHRVVVTVTDDLVQALARAEQETLDAVAMPWARTEEFRGRAHPEQLATLLSDLSALARLAAERGQRVYCWVCV